MKKPLEFDFNRVRANNKVSRILVTVSGYETTAKASRTRSAS